MPTLPVSNSTEAAPAETVEQCLRQLEAVLKEETCFLSNSNLITGHWAFQDIIGMGEAVVPLLLRDLEKKPLVGLVLGSDNRGQPHRSARRRKHCQLTP
jgi:hypothetical protein